MIFSNLIRSRSIPFRRRPNNDETVETMEWAIVKLMHEIAPNLWRGSKYLWEGENE